MLRRITFGYFLWLCVLSIFLYLLDFFDIPSLLGFTNNYDWLCYFGTIIGSYLGFFGIYMTICENRKNFEIDTINKVKPFLSCQILQSEFKRVFLEESKPAGEKGENTYKTYRLKSIYYSVSVDDIKIYSNKNLPHTDRQTIEQNGYFVEDTGMVFQL